MATYVETLSGKVKWCQPLRLDGKFNDYATQFFPDPPSLEKIKALLNGNPPIMNKLKKDDDGSYYLRLSCKPNKLINGVIKPFKVDVFKEDGVTPTEVNIGNGSDVTVQIEVYTYRKGEGKAIRWKSIRIDNLVPYEANTMRPERMEDMSDTPKPVWG